jgi:poly-beta-1,6-N-acetyl-D-glucosamine biosynthesis protein PgaD
LDQSGSGIQALTLPIIMYSTAHRPLVRLRDGILFAFCWVMWTVVLTTVASAIEWNELGGSIIDWFAAHLTFLNGLMASFHFPVEYVFLMTMLVCVFLVWTNLGMLLSMQRGDYVRGGLGALSLDELALHFGLDSALIGAMQKEAHVTIYHSSCGRIIGVRRTYQETDCGDAKPLHLVT